MHRAHDYRFLVERWKAVAAKTGLRLEKLVTVGKHNLFFLRTKSLEEGNGIYLSAGIHGDEPASTEALIAWAERNVSQLRKIPLLIFPCLNPWGLVQNCRLSEDGDDLNRSFHRDELPLIAAMKRVVGAHRFAVSMMLHEDYDGQGLYLYEVQRLKPFWGEGLIQAASAAIPIEGRMQVDGRKAVAGVIRRKFDFKRFEKIGYPEAIWLHLSHSDRTFTVETPSEFALEQRVEAHVAVIRECVRRVGENGAGKTSDFRRSI